MEDAEDIMLYAFAEAASGTAVFSGRSSFKTWLFSIGRNQARKGQTQEAGRKEPGRWKD